MPELLNPFDGSTETAEDPQADIDFFEMLQRMDARRGREPDPKLITLIDDARARLEAIAALGREEPPA